MQQYYDDSDYFERHLSAFSNLGSRFQQYRIKSVLGLYSVNRSERVLDLGCGWGTFCFALAGRCKTVIGVDYSEKSIEICRHLAKARSTAGNVEFICADARNTGLKPCSFDVVICADLVEHLCQDSYEEVIVEARKVLRKGGKIVIWTPHRGHFLEILKNRDILLRRDLSHVDYKSMERLTSSLSTHGFVVEKAYYKESHLPVIDLAERLFMRWLPFLRRRIAILAEKRA